MVAIHLLNGDYLTTISYYEKTFEIWQKCVPTNHLKVTKTDVEMAGILDGHGQYKEAIGYAKKAVATSPTHFWT